MDPQHPTYRERPASARRRLQEGWTVSSQRLIVSRSARMRRTQRSGGGGVSSSRQYREQAAQRQSGLPMPPDSHLMNNLRDRLHTGADTTRAALSERMKQAATITQRLREPLGRPNKWIAEPSSSERLKNWAAEAMPFAWRERAHRRGFWRRRVLPVFTVCLCIAFAFTVGAFALRTAGHAAGAFKVTAPTPQATTNGSVMISPFNPSNGSPTPTEPQYSVGVWVSDTLPQGNSVQVFVRVSNHTLPQPGAQVFITANTPNGDIKMGPFPTDNYGVATATLNYGGVGQQQPIFLTATTTINSQDVSGDYTFVTY